MLFGYPIWAVIVICVGVFLASFVDAIGGGGGIISLPTYLIAGMPMHLALGTGKLASCLGTAASTFRYVKNKCVDWVLAIPSIPLALIGSYFGTRLQLSIDERYLKYLLLIVLPVVAVFLFKEKNFSEERGEIALWKQRVIVWTASFLLGAYDGFYGPGSGTFMLLCFCKLAKMDLRSASGNVKLVNFSSNVGALITSLFAGTVLIPMGLLAAAFSFAGHYVGAGLMMKNGSKIVRPIILLVLALLAVKLVLEFIGF